ncbi:MAG TPA: M48 family metallopeptidase [Gammaproteobacteria bacterium]
MHWFTLLFLVMLVLATGVEIYLAWRHLRHVAAHRGAVPAAFAQRISLDEHQKAADYTGAKTRLAIVQLLYGALLVYAWTLGGGVELLDHLWRNLALAPLITGIGFLISAFLIIGLLELPFTLFQTFHIEQRFGFNRMTSKLFIADLIKSSLLTLLIGAPLAAAILWLMGNAGALWWLWAWGVWFGFSLLMMWAFPAFIAPLFNKFTPLEAGELQQRIQALLQRCGFTSNGIFVMDGSRRSAHGNAYFTGVGNKKRIVFFDTLLNSLSPDEIEAVLAHELGHFRRHHVRKRLITMAVVSLLGLALLGWLSSQLWFYNGLGVTQPSIHVALLLFLIAVPIFTFFTRPLMARTLRRHEFEADNFAAEQSSAHHLIDALVKLYQENASTLTPDPWHSAFHDSHPPAPVRIAHLSARIPTQSVNEGVA